VVRETVAIVMAISTMIAITERERLSRAADRPVVPGAMKPWAFAVART